MSMNLEYLYRPVDIDDELFISDVPFDLLKNSIKKQFKEPFEYRKNDYIQSFINRYEFNKDNTTNEDEASLELERNQFIMFLEDIFQKKLNIGFSDLEDKSDDEQHDMLHLTYRFFIKNIKKNFVNVIYNFIDNERTYITNNYDKNKSVTFLNFKDELSDEYDIIVLSNLGDIIQDILNKLKEDMDIMEFFNLCKGDEPILELEYVEEGFNTFEITGNFIEKYVDMVTPIFMVEIQSKIRNKILKKYPNRVEKE